MYKSKNYYVCCVGLQAFIWAFPDTEFGQDETEENEGEAESNFDKCCVAAAQHTIKQLKAIASPVDIVKVAEIAVAAGFTIPPPLPPSQETLQKIEAAGRMSPYIAGEFDFTLSDCADDYFGPIGMHNEGWVELSEAQAEVLIGKIAEGR